MSVYEALQKVRVVRTWCPDDCQTFRRTDEIRHRGNSPAEALEGLKNDITELSFRCEAINHSPLTDDGCAIERVIGTPEVVKLNWLERIRRWYKNL